VWVEELVKCPKCGGVAANPVKTWSMIGKPNKLGEKFKLTMGLFECRRCGERFRKVVSQERVSIKGMVEKIKGIEGGLTQTLRSLREKLTKLESERASLMAEIEELKKAAESRASRLENEIAALREEVKSLKQLLGSTE